MRPHLAAAAFLLAVASGAQAQAPADPCVGWETRTVASGLGSLENLEPDGRGHLLLSATARDSIEVLSADGSTRPLATGIAAPGGLRLRGPHLLANAGNTAPAAATGQTNGRLLQVDLATGEVTELSTGLVSPNGLLLLPDGDALVSRTVNAVNPTGITRIDLPSGTAQTGFIDLADSNGLALDAAGTSVFVAETFTLESRLYRVPLDRPQDVAVVAQTGGVGVPKGLDDIAIDDQDIVYATANGSGEVLRIDPATGSSCVIATGLRNASAVKLGIGCGDFGAGRLYAVGFDGVVRELTPPAGVTLRPGRWQVQQADLPAASCPPPAAAPPSAAPPSAAPPSAAPGPPAAPPAAADVAASRSLPVTGSSGEAAALAVVALVAAAVLRRRA